MTSSSLFCEVQTLLAQPACSYIAGRLPRHVKVAKMIVMHGFWTSYALVQLQLTIW